MPKIQVFGLEDSPATRAAIRFFRERRIVVSFVDLQKRPIAPGELRRFVDRLGAAGLLDVERRANADAGLADRLTGADSLLERARADARLLRLPLVRLGDDVTAGRDEATWKAWLARRG